MDGYLLFVLDKLAVVGFLETRASFSADLIVTYLAVLPILSGFSILFAIRKHLKLHQVTQFLLFFLTFITLASFAYIVHYKEGFNLLVQESSLDSNIAFAALLGHIIITTVTLTLWLFALIYALSDKKRRALPGMYSVSHAKAGKRVFKGILLTAISSVGIYWILFIS